MKPAPHFPRFGKTLLAAALVAMAGTGCVEIQTRTTGTQPTRSLAANRAIVGDITSAKAMESLYGNVHVAKSGEKVLSFGGFVGGDRLNCTEWALHTASNGKKREFCKVLGEKYTDGNAEKYLLVTAPEDGGFLVTTTYVKKDGRWVQESINAYDGEGDTEGMPIDSVVPLRAKGGKPGVLITYAGVAKCGSFWVEAIAPYGSGTKAFPLFSPDGDGDDSTSFDMCFQYEVGCDPSYSASFDKASHDGYHDIIVKHDDKCKYRRRGTQRWTFQNGKYVKAKAAAKGGKKGAKKRK